jgi:hypothetical protein
MSLMVRVPVTPARDGNRFWKVILMVGTSDTHTVPAAPKVNVSGSVVLVVVDDVLVTVVVVDDVVGAVDVVVVPGRVVLVEEVVDVGDVVVVEEVVDVVVSSGGQSAGNSTTAVAVSPELA